MGGRKERTNLKVAYIKDTKIGHHIKNINFKKFQVMGKHSLLKYKMDKKESASSLLSVDSTSKIASGSSLPLDESYQEFQATYYY